MASNYNGLFYCEKCHKARPEKEFYHSNNKTKYPNNGVLTQCKDCITMHIDNWDPNTYLWILEECDVPYIPEEWISLLEKYAKDPSKITGASIIGRYFAKMKLKQFRDYRWSDSEFLQELAKQRVENALKLSGNFTASEIAQAVQDSVALPERPYVEPTQPAESSYVEETPQEEISLTPEEITYLRIKWGKAYKPDEWLQLEKFYTDMMNSYDIQTAGHIDTLKFICKTSLKANQLLDLGDVDGAQKMIKMYDSLMKSGKFKLWTMKYFSV